MIRAVAVDHAHGNGIVEPPGTGAGRVEVAHAIDDLVVRQMTVPEHDEVRFLAAQRGEHVLRGRMFVEAIILSATMSATTLAEKIDAAAAKTERTVIACRRDIHQNPELGNREFRTSKIVFEHLKKLGLQPRMDGIQTAVQLAGVNSALNAYAAMVKQDPTKKVAHYDELLAVQAKGELLDYVESNVFSKCRKK